MSMNKLSVIVPIYNVADYLKSSISSIKNQTYRDFKCILVNDGSTDNSLNIAADLIKDDKRFSIVSKKNGGLGSARNYGLDMVDSEYVYFFDSDDILEKECFEKCVEALSKSKADIVIFDYYQYRLSDNSKELISNPIPNYYLSNINKDKSILTKISNCAWNKMYKTSLFKSNNINYPEGRLYEDLGTTYNLLLKANNVIFIKEALYDYVVDRTGNITGNVDLNKLADIIYECDKLVSFYKENNEFNNYYEELKYLCGINIIETLRKLINVKYSKEVGDFIDKCFYFLKDNFNDYPKCKYIIKKRKNDWIYSKPLTTKLYLKLR